MVERILEKIATFLAMGSEWRINSVIKLELHTVRYTLLEEKLTYPYPKSGLIKRLLLTCRTKITNAFCGVFLEH